MIGSVVNRLRFIPPPSDRRCGILSAVDDAGTAMVFEKATRLDLMIVAACLEAQAPSPQAELVKLEEVWNSAHLKGDGDALDELWDADFVVTVPRMQRISRASALSLTRSGRFTFDKYETTDVTARVFGDTGIVGGRLHRARRLNDTPIE